MEDVQSFEEGTTEPADAEPASDGQSEADGIAEAKTTEPTHPDANEDGVVSAAVPYKAGADLDEAVDLWGDDFVHELFQKLFKRRLQNKIRRSLGNGVPVERVEENYSIDNYDPRTSSRGGGDPVEDILKKTQNMDEEDLEEVREALFS